MIFRGLAGKLFLTHLGLGLLVVTVITVVVLDTLQSMYLQSLQTGLQDRAYLLAERLAPELAGGHVEQVGIFLAALGVETQARVMVADVEGNVVGSTEPAQARLRGTPIDLVGLRPALRGRMQRAVDPTAPDLVFVAAPVEFQGEPVGAIRLSYSLAEFEAQIDRVLRRVGLPFLGAGTLSALLGVAFAYRLSRPARRLAEAAHALAGGDLARRTGVSGADEVGEAARAFDQMASRLQQLHAEREALLGRLSHEIHSTITGMVMAVEVLQRSKSLDRGSRHMLLSGLATNTQRLRRLANDLLEAARLARGQFTLRRSAVSPADLVREVASSFAGEASQRGIRLETAVHERLATLDADADRLAQALGNLVENALRHSPPGGQVLVAAEETPEWCILSVQDEGPGVDPAFLPRLFTPYQQATGGQPGRLGLGLSIAKAMIEAHHGHIQAAQAPTGGAIFRLLLPLPGAGPGRSASPPQPTSISLP